MEFWIFIIVLFIATAFAIKAFAKNALKSFDNPKEKINKPINPYIDHHKKKMQNDLNYDEYLKWLDKIGEGVPIKKVVAPEDKMANDKIRWLVPRRKFDDNDKLF